VSDDPSYGGIAVGTVFEDACPAFLASGAKCAGHQRLMYSARRRSHFLGCDGFRSGRETDCRWTAPLGKSDKSDKPAVDPAPPSQEVIIRAAAGSAPRKAVGRGLAALKALLPQHQPEPEPEPARLSANSSSELIRLQELVDGARERVEDSIALVRELEWPDTQLRDAVLIVLEDIGTPLEIGFEWPSTEPEEEPAASRWDPLPIGSPYVPASARDARSESNRSAALKAARRTYLDSGGVERHSDSGRKVRSDKNGK
jgi:hypothetical protein